MPVAKGARALYCILCGGTELWVAISQDPSLTFSVTAVLSRRSRTGDNCSRLITFELQLRGNKFVPCNIELKS